METQTPPVGSPDTRSFALDQDIIVAGQVVHSAGTKITVRKPAGGALRGLSLSALMQADYTVLETIAPRVTQPILHKQDFAAMDPADIVQFAGELMDFLLPKAARPDSPTE